MKKKTAPSRIPADMKKIVNVVQHCVCGFDKLQIHIDRTFSDSEVMVLKRLLRRHCKEIRVSTLRNIYQPIWETTIDLSQPTIIALKLLNEAIWIRGMSRISYVEIAIDWLTNNPCDAQLIAGYLVEHLYIPYIRSEAYIFESTVYFNRRENNEGNRNSKIPALYADKPSKLLARKYPEPCCHFEHRLSGSPECSKAGLNTISDCINFDHEYYWLNSLRLFDISKTDIGRVITPNPNISEVALRNCARQFLKFHQNYGDTEKFYVLQNCLITKVALKKIINPIDNRHLLKKITLV